MALGLFFFFSFSFSSFNDCFIYVLGPKLAFFFVFLYCLHLHGYIKTAFTCVCVCSRRTRIIIVIKSLVVSTHVPIFFFFSPHFVKVEAPRFPRLPPPRTLLFFSPPFFPLQTAGISVFLQPCTACDLFFFFSLWVFSVLCIRVFDFVSVEEGKLEDERKQEQELSELGVEE